MGSLRINKVIYSGTKYHFESANFDKNIIVIEGYNGTGKSTLCNLIYFALGGEVTSFRKDSDTTHTQITTDTDNYVDLFTSISGQEYLLRRYIGDNDITVIPYTIENPEFGPIAKNTAIYPINRRGDKVIFSDWILEKLGISVVELFYGYSTFKINFANLMRLIYHDQQPDPENIYKKIDTNSGLVSDSELLRKAIFELLVGKSYSNYYDAIVAERRMAKKQSIAKSLVDEYMLIADKLRQNEELKNISFLQTEILNKEKQLDKLHSARSTFKVSRNNRDTIAPGIDNLKSDLINLELDLSEKKEILLGVLDERHKLASIKTETATEISHIQKVIFSHEQLNLFAPDTCPYCLTKVDRAANHCVCGASVEEEQYERFFYSSHEYKEILKSKLKTLRTIDLALNDCSDEVSQSKSKIAETEDNIQSSKRKLSALLERIDEPVDLESLNDIDDKILEIREEIGSLHQLLEIEAKLKGLQDSYDKCREDAKSAELKRKEHEIKAQQDITAKVNKFSKIYNDLVIDTLQDCRSARIRLDTYLPSINDGEYKEASSRVSIRLMYYVTLMHMALEEPEVAFPRFLLIDTPETAGIELENLIKCFSKFEELDEYQQDYQVILATGIGKYPDTLSDNRVLFMPNKEKENMLLQEVH